MSKIIIEVEVRSVYGKDLFYPVNEAAKLLAEISAGTTLTEGVLKKAVRIGMSVEVRQPVRELSFAEQFSSLRRRDG